jgi:CBS domain-containing protein
LQVQDVMNRNHPSIYSDELATKARSALRNYKIRVIPVVNEHKQLLGMISRSDIMHISSSVSTVRAKGIMSESDFVVTPEMDAVEAVREMLQQDQWYAPVVRSQVDKTYMGMLGLEHVIKAYCDKKSVRLSTPLSEVMTAEKLLSCSLDDEVGNVWQKMKERSFAACPVVKKGKPIGILSQQNLLETGAIFPTFEDQKGRFRSQSKKISAIMKTPVLSLKPENTVGDAARIMLERDIGRVPLIDQKGQLIGIVDREDVLRRLIE